MTGIDLEAIATALTDVAAGGAGYYGTGVAATSGSAVLDIATEGESAQYQVDTSTDSMTDSDSGAPGDEQDAGLIFRFRTSGFP